MVQSAPIAEPTGLAATVTKDSITATWNAFSATAGDDGYAPITGWKLSYDSTNDGTIDTTITISNPATLTTTINSLNPSQTYKMNVLAFNQHGDGPVQTTPITPSTSNVPATPVAPTIVQDGVNINITWTAPAHNGQALSGYQVLW